MTLKKIISVLLVFSMAFTATASVYASTGEAAYKHQKDNIFQGELVIGDKVQGLYTVEDNGLKVVMPSKASGELLIDAGDSESEPLGMKLPESVIGAKGVVDKDGTISYTSEDDSVSIEVQVVKDKNMECDSVRSLIVIENENAPNKYDFCFNIPDSYKIIFGDEYLEEYASEDERVMLEDASINNLIYILNENNEIINTIESPWAVDANGEDVNTWFEINENTLIQIVEFDENSKFPIVADPTSHPAITKYNYITLEKANNGASLAKKARKKINDRQNSTLSTFLSVMTTIISFIPVVNIVVSYTNSYISAVSGGVSSNLERQEDEYTLIYETFTGTTAKEKKAIKAQLKLPLVGRWHGNSRGYIYTQKTETLKFYDKNGNEVSIS